MSLKRRTHVGPDFSESPGGNPQNTSWRNIPSPALEQSPDFSLTLGQQLGASWYPQDSLCHPQTHPSKCLSSEALNCRANKKPNLVHIRVACHSWSGSVHPNTFIPTFPTPSCPGHSTQGRKTSLWIVVWAIPASSPSTGTLALRHSQ